MSFHIDITRDQLKDFTAVGVHCGGTRKAFDNALKNKAKRSKKPVKGSTIRLIGGRVYLDDREDIHTYGQRTAGGPKETT